MSALTEKKCSRCKKIKPTHDFNKSNTKHDGFRCECRECQSLQTKRDSELRRIKVNEKKFNQVFQSLKDPLKKVYSCLPATEEDGATWGAETFDASDVVREMKKFGFPGDRRHILGCLDSLKNAGLVTEPLEGRFTKIKVRLNKTNNQPENFENNPHANKKEIIMPPKEIKTDRSEENPIDKIGFLVTSAQKIMSSLKILCDEIESAAIEVEQMFEAKSKDAQKLKQLQSLLKGLNES